MTGRNLIHGSDARESAEREIALFFGGRDVPTWERDSDRWVLE
jgi:nucleoside-diphosphate kinase